MGKTQILALWMGATTLCWMPISVFAQDAQVSSRSERQVPQLQEVVVTATRRPENLQTVPVAVSVVSANELRDQRVETAYDLQNLVPSLTVTSTGLRNEETYVIRGMGPTAGFGEGGTIGGGGSGVVVYFAETPDNAASIGQFYDLANVQVLKGPQGTLFGKNTTGGAVLLTPQRPTDNFGGFAEVSGGNYDMRSVTGALNLPVIKDKFLLRFSAQAYRRGGFTIDRGPVFAGKDYDNRSYWSGRVSALIKPLESLENYTIFQDFQSNENGTGSILSTVNPANPVGQLLESFLGQQQAAGVRSTSFSVDQLDKRETYGVINTTTWTASPDLIMKNIFSYKVQKLANSSDADASPYVISDGITPPGRWHIQTGTTTEEPQVQGTARGGALHWTAGGYYEYGHNIAPQPFQTNGALGTLVIVQSDQTNYERSRGLYAQATYDLGDLDSPLQGLKLTAGYRHTWDEFGYSITGYSPSYGNACLTSAGIYPPCQALAGNGTSSSPSWTVGLSYLLAKNTMVYLRSSRGYIPGGFNPAIALDPGGAALPAYRFKPADDMDVELGVKSDFEIAGMPARVDADVFVTDFQNMQRLATESLFGGAVQATFTTNASKARIEGFELEGTLVPTHQFRLQATYSYNDGVYTEIDPAAAPSLVGVPFAYLPKQKASLIANYFVPIDPAAGDLKITASYTYQSRYFGATAVQPLDYIQGYGLLNGAIDWDNIMQGPIDLSLFVTNALNRTYRAGQFGDYVASGEVMSIYGEPRMFGARIRYRFGYGD